MSNIIKIKRGYIPLGTDSLLYGELGYNENNGHLYIGNSSNEVAALTVDQAVSCSGNAATATAITSLSTNDKASSTDTKRRVWFSYNDNATGRPAYDDALTYQSSTGTLFATKFSGALTGNVTGNCSGSSGSCTGNAATATSAGTCTGNAATATKANLVKYLHTNEINFSGGAQATCYFNYRNADTDASATAAAITYGFCNYTSDTSKSTIVAGTFSGNATSATKATQDSDGNQINTTYYKAADATTSAHGLMSSTDKTKLDATTDYIIAQGVSGYWTYIKYNSGIAICFTQWGYQNGSNQTISKSSWASGYEPTEGYFLFPAYPFAFAYNPTVSISFTHCDTASVTGDIMYIFSPGDVGSRDLLNYPPAFKPWRGSSKTFGHPYYNCMAIGWWK